ncbi:MAG: hypothetical protein WAJ85_04930 [Candidatus Baltobacteraceae bacterium]|jgi:hypothetical protein
MTSPPVNVTPGSRPGTRAPSARVRQLYVVVVLVVTAILFRLVVPHHNRYERLADDVTKAIVANDMRPVEGDFNALRRPQLEDRAKVGQLSNDLNALGAFKGVKETTPSGASEGYHTFSAAFEKATWNEDMTLDADGKIAAFHVHPSTAQ